MDKKDKYLEGLDTMHIMLRQPYEITMARHRFNVYEMRIMFRIIEALQPKMMYDKKSFQIDKTNLGDTKIIIPTRLLLASGDKNYKPVRDALDSLTNKHITISVKDSKGVAKDVFTNLVKEGVYDYRSEFIEVEISRNLMPELLGLSKNYTKYLLNVAFNSSSPNVMKLYQYVSQWRDKKQTFVKLSSLKEWLKIEEKYKYPSQIKKWILEPAMQELKEKADVWFGIAARVTEGRRMVGWKFNIYTKPIPPQNLPTSEQEEVDHIELQKRLIEKYKLGRRQAKKVITWLSGQNQRYQELRKTLYDIQLMILNHRLQNIGGYTAKGLTEKLGIKI